jgi:hypothetical protein
MIVGKPRKKETNMPKNLTRKGLAFGAGIALVASGLAGAPARADTTGPVTLVPTAGTTFNSILQSGISLQSEIDPGTSPTAAATLTYVISNPTAASITAVYDGKALAVGNAAGTSVRQTTGVAATDIGANLSARITADGVGTAAATATTSKFIYVTGALQEAIDADAVLNDEIPANTNLAGINLPSTLTFSTTATTTVTLTVRAFLDVNSNGIINTFEQSSDLETITLFPASAVSAVTSLDGVVVGARTVKSTVVYGNDVNPYMVKARTAIQLLRNGAVVNVTANTTSDLVPTDVGATNRAGAAGYTKNTLVSGVGVADGEFLATQLAVAADTGIFSAVTFYETTAVINLDAMDGKVRMGAPSQILDLSTGSNADVDQLTLDVTDTANYKETIVDAEEIYVRSGTKSVTFGVQARDAAVVLKAANIDVRAIVTETALDAAAEITISGATGKLVKGGAAITAYGVTDSNGQASFTVTSKDGKKNDAIDVAIQYKKANGVWTLINARAGAGDDVGGVDGGLDIKWFDTLFDAFKPKPAAFVSGANPVVTFKVTDQWSQPVSFIDGTRLSVYASAYVGGVENSTKYAERVTVVDGAAAFTFANFAAAGATAELRGILYKGAELNIATSNVTVYNTADTSALNVATSFKTDITYNDYVTGSSTDGTVAAALVATGLGADTVRATIAGNVNNTTGSGQPGAAVTLSAAGVLFYDAAAKVYALNTITTTSNEFGAWTVFAYSHTVNTKGVDVSITSGTVTKSTKLITFFPKDLLTRNNLKFSFDVPATLVMNTTYAVIAKLADKWGNPIQTAGATGSVSVVGNGSVQVNGVTAATVKDFNAKGEATVFIRSIKDIAGPSSVSATLLAVTSQYEIDPAVNGVTNNDATGAPGLDSFGSLLSTTVNVTGTAWDETLFEKTIAVERDVVTTAPAASSDTIVNVGTFSGKLVVYAQNAAGSKVSYKIAGKWVTQVVTSDLLMRYDRVVGATGATIKVDIYVDGVLKLAKSVVTK